jgi:hypothetical protein
MSMFGHIEPPYENKSKFWSRFKIRNNWIISARSFKISLTCRFDHWMPGAAISQLGYRTANVDDALRLEEQFCCWVANGTMPQNFREMPLHNGPDFQLLSACIFIKKRKAFCDLLNWQKPRSFSLLQSRVNSFLCKSL